MKRHKNLHPSIFQHNIVDNLSRYQKGLAINHIFPGNDGRCACGCNQDLTGRQKRWASIGCRDGAYIHFAIIKGDTQIIREELFFNDLGFCRNCGVFDEFWEADHIIPVHKGGGGCTIVNLQTLCQDCHSEKTHTAFHQRVIS